MLLSKYYHSTYTELRTIWTETNSFATGNVTYILSTTWTDQVHSHQMTLSKINFWIYTEKRNSKFIGSIYFINWWRKTYLKPDKYLKFRLNGFSKFRLMLLSKFLYYSYKRSKHLNNYIVGIFSKLISSRFD